MTVGRFAGAPQIQGFLNKNRVDYGSFNSSMDNFRAGQEQSGLKMMGDTTAAGIDAAGMVEEAGILADAQAGLAQAQGNASAMGAIGGIAESAIGAFGGSGGGGSSYTPSGGWGNFGSGLSWGGF